MSVLGSCWMQRVFVAVTLRCAVTRMFTYFFAATIADPDSFLDIVNARTHKLRLSPL